MNAATSAPRNGSNHILRDLRHACRSLRKSPGFAVAVVATLALGIGANTAIFSLIYSVLLKPLPYPAPDRIFSVETMLPRQNAVSSLPMRVQDYLEWRQANTAFESLAALTPAQWNLTGDGEPERLGGALVSANFFTFLGAPPQRGRGFFAGEETPGKQNVVVISDSLWRRRYGADPAILGKTIMLNAVPRSWSASPRPPCSSLPAPRYTLRWHLRRPSMSGSQSHLPMKSYRVKIGTTASWSAFATARAPSAAANSCRPC